MEIQRQKKTFWDHRRDEDINFIQAYIPLMGKCTTPKMERFRKYQNMYYRFYNDGDKPSYPSMNSLARAVGLTWSGIRWQTDYERIDELEEIGDRLLDAAIEEAKSGVAPLVKDIGQKQVPGSKLPPEWDQLYTGVAAGH